MPLAPPQIALVDCTVLMENALRTWKEKKAHTADGPPGSNGSSVGTDLTALIIFALTNQRSLLLNTLKNIRLASMVKLVKNITSE